MVEEEIQEAADSQRERDLRVLEETGQHVWNIGHAPGPTLDLVVLAHMRRCVVARVGRVAI